MTGQEIQRNPVEQLAEEFLARYRRGEHPSLTEYTEAHPELADDIRDLFPALVMIEEAKPKAADSPGPCSGQVTANGKALERLGDYRILREVGRGGMGIVYEAEQESLGRHVALKVLPFQTGLQPMQHKRFRREARSAARLHHTNIVPVFEVGEHQGVHYYAMQFIQGQGLDEVLVELRRMRKAKNPSPPTPRPQGASGELVRPLPVGANRELNTPLPLVERGRSEGLAGNEPSIRNDDHLARQSSLSACLASGLLSGQFQQAEDAGEDGQQSHICAQPPTGIGRPDQSFSLAASTARESRAATRPGEARDSASTSSILSHQSEFSTESDFRFYRSVARVGLQVAEALEYAHSQKVLHRDIKPSNLLLDQHGTVWVTDFGLATEEGSDLTRTGDIVGTLRYMAPERFRGESDPRSDIYSLGTTLYELLTLNPAFDGSDRPRLIERIAHEEPLRPRKLDPSIPRDLETIVLKAIAKESDRRYRSADALAEDLRCFLSDRPIRARRSSAAERAWRVCRRNPGIAVLSTLAIASLLIGLAAVTWQWRRAERHLAAAKWQQLQAEGSAREAQSQRHQAEANFQKARDAVDECFATVTENPVLQEPGMQSAREVLLRAALKYYQEFRHQRDNDPDIQAELAKAYARVGYITEVIGSKTDALAAYEQARELYAELVHAKPADAMLHQKLADCLHHLGNLYRLTGSIVQAENTLAESLTARQHLLDDHPEVADYRDELANSHQSLGLLYRTSGRPDQAEAAYRTALALRKELADQDPANMRYRSALARNYVELGRLLDKTSRPVDAEAVFGAALTLQEELVSDHPNVADHQADLAMTYNELGGFYLLHARQAEQAYLKALPLGEQLVREHPKVDSYQSELAHTLSSLGLWYSLVERPADAEAAYARALELRKQLASKHPEVAAHRNALSKTQHDIGLLYSRTGRPDMAKSAYLEALAIQQPLYDDHPTIGDLALYLACTLTNLGQLATEQGEPHTAFEWYDQAVRTLKSVLDLEPRQADALRLLSETHDGRARTFTYLGRHADAVKAWDRALELCVDGANSLTYRLARAASLARLGDHRQATAEAQDSMPNFETGWKFLPGAASVYSLSVTAVLSDAELLVEDQRRLAEQYADQAIALLAEGARHNGFWGVVRRIQGESLKTNRDFDALRSRPDFQKLIELEAQTQVK